MIRCLCWMPWILRHSRRFFSPEQGNGKHQMWCWWKSLALQTRATGCPPIFFFPWMLSCSYFVFLCICGNIRNMSQMCMTPLIISLSHLLWKMIIKSSRNTVEYLLRHLQEIVRCFEAVSLESKFESMFCIFRMLIQCLCKCDISLVAPVL